MTEDLVVKIKAEVDEESFKYAIKKANELRKAVKSPNWHLYYLSGFSFGLIVAYFIYIVIGGL